MNAPFRLAVIGPGRAGGALAIASRWVGHTVQTVPGPSGKVPPELEDTRVEDSRVLSPCDLLVLATPDDEIEAAALRLASDPPPARVAAHLSGFGSITRLEALQESGMEIGCLHPLQSLPSPRLGAAALAGSTAAVTAGTEAAAMRLRAFAHSLDIATFDLDDRLKPLYHAGAATVALGVATALGLAADLFEAAGVPLQHAGPLAEQVMRNCFRLGPDRSLTGPAVRGDRGTIAGHVKAAAAVSPDLAQQYRALGGLAASRAGTGERATGITPLSGIGDPS